MCLTSQDLTIPLRAVRLARGGSERGMRNEPATFGGFAQVSLSKYDDYTSNEKFILAEELETFSTLIHF
jgi:hypothetical protein